MSKGDVPAGTDPAQGLTARRLLLRVWQGMLVFGILNLPLVSFVDGLTLEPSVSGSPARTPGLASAALFALLVGVAAALPALVFGWRSPGWRAYAAGVLAGYVLMTILTSGECTLLTRSFGSESESRVLNGGTLYILALIVFIVALGSAGLAARRER